MAVTFPLAQTVQHLAYAGQVRDSRGNVIDAWADPVDVAVYGWHTSATHEPQIAGHDRVLVDAQVLAPQSWRPSPRDKVTLRRGGAVQRLVALADVLHADTLRHYPVTFLRFTRLPGSHPNGPWLKSSVSPIT